MAPPDDAVTMAEVEVATEPATALKVALIDPADTVTEAGTVRAALLALNDTTCPPVGAALVRLTVQVLDVPESNVEGAQASEDKTAGATRLRLAVCDPPFRVAVSRAVLSLETAATVAVKVALVAVAATVTEAGTATLELLLARLTARPPLGAARVRLIVQAEVPGAVKELGVQIRPLTCASGLMVTVVVTLPLPVAVIVTGWLAVTEPAVALKVALVDPADTVTEAGTVRAALLALNDTTCPPVGAALVWLTVQVLNAPEFTVEGEQASADKTAGATRVRLAVRDPPFRVAVSRAVASLETAATVAVKVALAAAAATVTDAGTATLELLLARFTARPPLGAA